jgi:hypothetical protein
VAGCAVAFADANCGVPWAFRNIGDGWEGEVGDIARVAAVAGAVVRAACW